MLPTSAPAPNPLERTSAPAMAQHLDSLDYLSSRQFDAFPTNVSALTGAKSVIMDERNEPGVSTDSIGTNSGGSAV